MKTAVIYARYSSDSQTEQSIEGQLRVCEEFAKNNNILILNTYIDRAMTGTNDNRPDFQQMILDSGKQNWDYVLVYKLDRFSRNKYETAKYKKILKDNGVKVLSAMENIPDSPEGLILESLLEGMAEYYSAELAQKVKRGMHETRLKGLYQGGGISYGYKIDGRKIVINEETSEVVKYIFKQYSNGVYVSTIIKTLTERGIMKNGRPFHPNTVYDILKNEKYTGIYKHEEEIITNMYPQLIDKETFEKVRSKSKANHYGKRSVKTIYLLRNKLKCGYCGMPISAESGTKRNGEKANYYKCIGIKKYHNGCNKETVRQDVLEEFVINTIIEELSKPKNLNTIVKNLMEIQNDLTTKNSMLNILLKQQKQTQNSLDNVMRAIEHGIMNNTTNKRMTELEKQLEDLERQILIERSKLSIRITEQEIKEFYVQALQKEPLVLINYLIKEIKLYNDKIEITFNSPIVKGPDNQVPSFISTIKKIKKYLPNKQIPILEDIQVEIYV